MKNLILVLVCLVGSFTLSAQAEQRFIEVTGSAESSIAPDQIELEIILREYYQSNNGKQKKDLAEVVDLFMNTLKKHGIQEDQLVIGDRQFSWYWWWSYRHENLMRRKFRLRLNADADLMGFIKDMDQQWVQNMSIAQSTHSEIQRLRKEIKIAAIKAAKEKANYLLESIDEELGRVISVIEIPNSTTNNSYWWGGNRNLVSNAALSPNTSNSDAISEVAAIKLRYEVKAKFEIR